MSMRPGSNRTAIPALVAIAVLFLGACEKKSEAPEAGHGHVQEKASEIVVTESAPQAPTTPPTPQDRKK